MVNQPSFVLWFTGLSGSGKTTIANELYTCFKNRHLPCHRLDGDQLRRTLCKDLGFTKADRTANLERAAFVANLLSQHGIVVLATFITPYEIQRRMLRKTIDHYIEIYVNAPLSVCEARDVKGLYKKAREKKISHFTGLSDDFDVPVSSDIELKTDRMSAKACANAVLQYLCGRQLITPDQAPFKNESTSSV